jgi:hypothetical protein
MSKDVYYRPFEFNDAWLIKIRLGFLKKLSRKYGQDLADEAMIRLKNRVEKCCFGEIFWPEIHGWQPATFNIMFKPESYFALEYFKSILPRMIDAPFIHNERVYPLKVTIELADNLDLVRNKLRKRAKLLTQSE